MHALLFILAACAQDADDESAETATEVESPTDDKIVESLKRIEQGQQELKQGQESLGEFVKSVHPEQWAQVESEKAKATEAEKAKATEDADTDADADADSDTDTEG